MVLNHRRMNWKEQMLKSLKIAVAAVIAISLAGELSLQYSATAGIITVLSIQNTKRETLKSAARRGAAFLCALILAKVCFLVLDYTLWAFAAYLFFFALVCLCMGWGEAIAMDSVLITHFLNEQSMAPQMLFNELLLFLIGTGMGILINLHLHRKEEQFERLAEKADVRIKGILHDMSQWLLREDIADCGGDCFAELHRALEEANRCAAANYGNRLFGSSSYELDYIEMREKQSVLLEEIFRNMISIVHLPNQAKQVAELLVEVEAGYHRENTVEGLLEKLDALLLEMKGQELPVSREEFEARAILFYILMQLKNLLYLKREFIVTHCEIECQKKERMREDGKI